MDGCRTAFGFGVLTSFIVVPCVAVGGTHVGICHANSRWGLNLALPVSGECGQSMVRGDYPFRRFFIVFDRFFLVMADRGNAGPAAHISFVVLCKPTTDVQWNWDASVYPQLYSMQSIS